MVPVSQPGSRKKDPVISAPPTPIPPETSENRAIGDVRLPGGSENSRGRRTMMRSSLKWAKVVAVVVLAAVPLVLAGHDGKKCSYGTQDCLDHMAAKMKTGGWVGVELEKDETTGALKVLKVVPGSPAESSGIQPGDQLFALNGVEMNDKNHDALKKAKSEWKPGQTVNYTIKRNGQEKKIALTLAPMPAEVLARFIGEHMLEHATVEVAVK
jgi:C-terminal processing protease CtpA/Prc